MSPRKKANFLNKFGNIFEKSANDRFRVQGKVGEAANLALNDP